MKKIAVLGIGRSSHYLLEYLNRQSAKSNWEVLACDLNLSDIQKKIAGLNGVRARELNIENSALLSDLVRESDIVVSLLPPALHPKIAGVCLEHSRHLATASYISPEMNAMHVAVEKKKLIFINEAGLDPGIDHMSAMKIIDNLHSRGARIFSFESYCGGLVAEEDCGNNPWKYKFSWNPMNVVLAGQGGVSTFRKNNEIYEIQGRDVFAKAEQLNISNLGLFDAYANRDSLSYTEIYGLQHVETFLRGTLRRKDFCKAWNVLVQLGFTENSKTLPAEIDTFESLVQYVTGKAEGQEFSQWLLDNKWIDETLISHFDYLTENSNEIHLTEKTAAGKLLQLLMEKWKLKPHDRDEVVMYHKMGYRSEEKEHWIESSLRLRGADSEHTAMAKTVGLPLAMAVEAILNGQIARYGVQAPITREWYEGILHGLEQEGILFEESHR